MTAMSNLPEELAREILSRVLFTSLKTLRCTCKTWNDLSKTRVFGKEAARNQFLGFMVINGRVCSLRLDFQGIHNEGDLVYKSTKKISKLDQTKTCEVLHCDGLLLCVHKNNNLVVWNLYLRQTRCIPVRCKTNLFILDDIGKCIKSFKLVIHDG
ncbi:hypothetical protein BRARA_I02214 [Brassica rapa]|uniref:F-box domain-containing protein n=1 Tax=Brassica campestris TaxID=3711 RepID=A0A397XWY0_BRACM|nr:hypothetical protein BRARA_I02214 [Brassica rapa]